MNTKNRKKYALQTIFLIAFILSVWQTTKSKLRNTFFFIKRVYFQNIWKNIPAMNSALRALMNKNKNWATVDKWIFDRIFFIFFKSFFTKKLFHLSKILKTNCKLWSAVPDFLFNSINRFELARQTAGRGGRLAPPVPSLIAKSCVYVGHSNFDRLCRLGIPMNCRSENDSTFETRKPEQKQKKS